MIVSTYFTRSKPKALVWRLVTNSKRPDIDRAERNLLLVVFPAKNDDSLRHSVRNSDKLPLPNIRQQLYYKLGVLLRRRMPPVAVSSLLELQAVKLVLTWHHPEPIRSKRDLFRLAFAFPLCAKLY